MYWEVSGICVSPRHVLRTTPTRGLQAGLISSVASDGGRPVSFLTALPGSRIQDAKGHAMVLHPLQPAATTI
jgi:hypothetical protein